jgi:hypothetical protein
MLVMPDRRMKTRKVDVRDMDSAEKSRARNMLDILNLVYILFKVVHIEILVSLV